jgi:hemoglobin/transferrin/lactoferrin receptor protein
MIRVAAFLLCLGWIAVALTKGLQPPPYLTLIDPLHLTEVAGAQVEIFADTSLFLLGHSDQDGRFPLGGQLPDSGYVLIQHPAYETRRISLPALARQQYSIYLDLRSYDTKAVLFTAGRQLDRSADIPHRIEVITARETQFRNPQTTAELLAQDGSVFVQKSQMGGGSPNLRGFEANKVLLVVDGVRMNNAIYRSGHLQNVITLDPNAIARSELMFGPGAVIYGSDALGGVMHFFTKDPHLRTAGQPSHSGEVSVRYGSVNQEKSLHAEAHLGGERWGTFTSLSYSDLGDLRSGRWRPRYPAWGQRDSLVIQANGQDSIAANDRPSQQRPSAYRQWHLIQKVLFVPDAHHSHLLNVQYSTSSDIPRYDRLTQTRDGRLRYAEWYYGPQQRVLASYRLRHHREGGWYDHLSVLPAYQYIEESRFDRLFQADWRDEQREQLHIVSLNVDARKRLGDHHSLTFGVEGFYNRVASTGQQVNRRNGETRPALSRYPAGGTDYATAAGYLTHRWQWHPTLTWQGGLRLTQVYVRSRLGADRLLPLPFEEIVQQHLAPSGNLSLNWRPDSRWQLAWLAGTGFRAPNLDDLGKVFDSQPGNVVVPNPDLQPEYTYNTELNLKRHWGERFEIGANGFFTYYDQAIVVRDFPQYGVDSIRYDGQLSKVQANVNAREAWLAGGSLSLRSQMGPWMAQGQLSYTYGLVIETKTLLDHLPPLFGSLRVGFEQGPWQAQAICQFNGWKRLDPNRSQPPFDDPRDLSNLPFATAEGWPAWWRVDLKGSYGGWSYATFQAGVENLFDLHYRPYSSRISAPGRNLYIAIKCTL